MSNKRSNSEQPNIERRKLLAYAAFGSVAASGIGGTETAARQPAQARRYDMKKSINLWAFPYPDKMTLRQCLQLAKDAGFDGIELNYDLESELSPKSGIKDFQAIRKMADEIGIQISGVCSFLFWPYPLTSNDPGERARGMELAGKMTQAAHDLGTENLLVVPGAVHMPWREDHDPTPNDVCLARAKEAIGKLLPTAEKLKISLNMENIFFNGFLLSPFEMADFVDGFCIDKLYSPDNVTGRLGLVELRGFEMPPHPRMSLTQQLLVRALASTFWKQPYRERLSDWGTALHDRFMLPHFVWENLIQVLDFVNGGEQLIDENWFAPHFEFRFPKIGQVTYRDIGFELRSAIEPWYVMGEEPGSNATTRFVDSSLERLQVSVNGFDATRYRVVCNGVDIPLHATTTQGHYVAGVRFRAWQPPRCLHPTIGIHSPLSFNIVDTHSGRSIGGCTYHIVHPGGRANDRFPINAQEAESRRAARFDLFGLNGNVSHTEPTATTGTGPYPVTLDLRRTKM